MTSVRAGHRKRQEPTGVPATMMSQETLASARIEMLACECGVSSSDRKAIKSLGPSNDNMQQLTTGDVSGNTGMDLAVAKVHLKGKVSRF